MLLEAAGEYVFPCLFQFLEAAHTLWLVALSSIFKTSVASLALSLSISLSSAFLITLSSLTLTLMLPPIKPLVISLGPYHPGQSILCVCVCAYAYVCVCVCVFPLWYLRTVVKGERKC